MNHFFIHSNETLFNKIKKCDRNLCAIVQNDILITPKEVNEWKFEAENRLPKELIDETLKYLREEYKKYHNFFHKEGL